MMRSPLVRINRLLWPRVLEEAEKRCTKPGRLIDLAVRRELGFEPDTARVADDVIRDVDDQDPEDVPCLNDEISPLAGNLGEVRLWQAKLKQAEEELEGYQNGVLEEDWVEEQKSDYVIDCVARRDEAREKLHVLLPPLEEAKHVG